MQLYVHKHKPAQKGLTGSLLYLITVHYHKCQCYRNAHQVAHPISSKQLTAYDNDKKATIMTTTITTTQGTCVTKVPAPFLLPKKSFSTE
jgi:hypothetical protein